MKNNVVKYSGLIVLVAQVALSVIIALSRETIPTHWDAFGEMDDSGSSSVILLLSLVNIILYLFLNWLADHPELCHYPRSFKSRETAYKNMKALMSNVVIFVNVLFFYITLAVFLEHLNTGIFYIILILFLLTVVVGMVKVAKS